MANSEGIAANETDIARIGKLEWRLTAAIPGLDGDLRIGALDVAVEHVLGKGQEAHPRINRAVFELGIGELEHKAARIPIRARAGQVARAAEPGGRAKVGDEIEVGRQGGERPDAKP